MTSKTKEYRSIRIFFNDGSEIVFHKVKKVKDV